MPLSASLVWEVRTTGSDANGGAFRAGAPGTDYSQQDAAQAVYTDLVIGPANNQLTSTASPFTAADVGNVLNINGGTGFATGRYEVSSVSGGVATVDRAVGTVASTGGTGQLGGALATINALATAMVASNRAFIRASGTYTTSSTISFGQSVSPQGSTPPSRLIGYATTRGDDGRATLQLQTNAGITGLHLAGNGWFVDNLAVDCNSLGTSLGIDLAGGYSRLYNCKVSNYAYVGIYLEGLEAVECYRCEVTGGGASAFEAILAQTGGARIAHCWVHDNACSGIAAYPHVVILGNVVTDNIGSSSDGIRIQYGCLVVGNTVYKSGRHGIHKTDTYFNSQLIVGNLLAENGGYGLVGNSIPGCAADPINDGNAYYANTGGTRANIDDTTSHPQNGVAPYANAHDVVLSVDPFVSKASQDFRLNAAAGGGASCRGAGLPRSWPGLPVGGYPDMGAVQHQDSGGGGPANVFWIEG